MNDKYFPSLVSEHSIEKHKQRAEVHEKFVICPEKGLPVQKPKNRRKKKGVAGEQLLEY